MQTRRFFTLARPLIAGRSIYTAALLAPALFVGACVADDVDPVAMGGSGGSGMANGGSSGQTGNTGGSGNNMGGGGSGGGGGVTSDPEFGIQIECAQPTQTLIADFSPAAPPGGADAGADAGAGADAAVPAPGPDYSFGDFYMTFSGGTYVYPTAGAYAVTSDLSENNWHITGDIGDYSGFGLYFGGTFPGPDNPNNYACTVVDMTAYDGIRFTISGSVAMGNMLTMSVAIARNNVSHVWLNTVPMPPPNPPAERNAGRCIPASANQFDGSCASPAATVPVTAEPTTVTLLWSDFTNGRPEAAVNPEEITGIAWAFPAPPGAGTATPMPYAADIVIDDIQFVDNP